MLRPSFYSELLAWFPVPSQFDSALSGAAAHVNYMPCSADPVHMPMPTGESQGRMVEGGVRDSMESPLFSISCLTFLVAT